MKGIFAATLLLIGAATAQALEERIPIVRAAALQAPRGDETRFLLDIGSLEAVRNERILSARMRIPLPGVIPPAPRTKSMDMWVKSCRFSKCLYNRNHSWTKALFLESGGAHELSQGLVGTSGELAEKLAVVEKIDS